MMSRPDYFMVDQGRPVSFEIGSSNTSGTGYNEAALAGSFAIVGGAVAIPALGIRMAALSGNPYYIMYGWYRSPILKTAMYLGVRGASGLYGVTRVYASAKLGGAIMNPLQTYRLVRTGQYDRAVVSFYGPVGSLLIYDRLKEHYSRSGSSSKTYDLDVVSDTPSKPSKTWAGGSPKESGWKKGIRRRKGVQGSYCRKHKTYDGCYLRTK